MARRRVMPGDYLNRRLAEVDRARPRTITRSGADARYGDHEALVIGLDGPPVLILGDPASLYVCRATADKPWQDTSGIDSISRATVVTGSTAPRVDPAPDTVEAIRTMRSDHLLDAPVSGHVDDPELIYTARAYSALCDVIPADRAPWR